MIKTPEVAGEEETRAVAAHVFDLYLRLLHPFQPFVTEEVWSVLGRPGLLIRTAWPVATLQGEWPAETEGVDAVLRLVTALRRIRNEAKVDPKAPVDVRVQPLAFADTLESCAAVVRRLANVGTLAWTAAAAEEGVEGATVALDAAFRAAVDLGRIDRRAERERLERQLADAERRLATTGALLANSDFLAKAKPAAVEGAQAEAERLRVMVGAVQERLRGLAEA